MIQNDQFYVIECLGGGEGEGRRWPNGETDKQRVDMAPDTTDANSGTLWKALDVKVDPNPDRITCQFQCQGSEDQSQYLNGLTRDGGVNLTRK